MKLALRLGDFLSGVKGISDLGQATVEVALIPDGKDELRTLISKAKNRMFEGQTVVVAINTCYNCQHWEVGIEVATSCQT